MDNPSPSWSSRNDTKLPKTTWFARLTDYLFHNALSKLPAMSFASAACDSKSWNRICNHVLSRSKLTSALSRSTDAEKLGSKISVITSFVAGIIGVDTLTDELREVFEAIPLLQPNKALRENMIDRFVMKVRNFPASVFGSNFPAAIMLFGDKFVGMKPILAKIDYAMAEETVIVGDPSSCFLFKSSDSSQNNSNNLCSLYHFDRAARRGDIMVIGVGIHPGDPFLFYNFGSENADASRELAFERLLSLKTESKSRSRSLTIGEPGNGEKGEMFGGFVFSSIRGGESFFGEFDEEDGFQFSHHFAGIPFAGVFCSAQIGRDMLSLTGEEKEEKPPCCLHVSGSVCLAMIYVP
ncbi:hypothetical protein UlMin_007664 [Ulmus minor]